MAPGLLSLMDSCGQLPHAEASLMLPDGSAGAALPGGTHRARVGRDYLLRSGAAALQEGTYPLELTAGRVRPKLVGFESVADSLEGGAGAYRLALGWQVSARSRRAVL